MVYKLLSEGGKSLWREIGIDMLRKGAAAVAVESVRAGIDILKQRRVRREVYEFDLWKKAQEKLREDSNPSAKEEPTTVAEEVVLDKVEPEPTPETRPPSV